MIICKVDELEEIENNKYFYGNISTIYSNGNRFGKKERKMQNKYDFWCPLRSVNTNYRLTMFFCSGAVCLSFKGCAHGKGWSGV